MAAVATPAASRVSGPLASLLTTFEDRNIQLDDPSGTVLQQCYDLGRSYGLSVDELSAHVDTILVKTRSSKLSAASLAELKTELSSRPRPKSSPAPLFHGVGTPMMASPIAATGQVKRKATAAPAPRETKVQRLGPAEVQPMAVHVLNKELPPPSTWGARTQATTVDTNMDTNAKPYRFMMTSLKQRADSLVQRMTDLSEVLDPALAATNLSANLTMDASWVVGRVNCTTDDPLTDKSAVLEDNRGNSAMLKLPLGFRGCLFPGQTLAVCGHRPQKHELHVSNLKLGVPAAQASVPAHDGLHMLAVAGPYTFPDDLKYQPIHDLFEAMQSDTPDVLVMMGPFVDDRHPGLATGNAKSELTEGDAVPVTFEMLFRELQLLIANKLTEPAFQRLRVVFVPSIRDLHHLPAFPQPAMKSIPSDDPDFAALEPDRRRMLLAALPRLHHVSNPGTFSVNGIVVGVSTNDILKHMWDQGAKSMLGSLDMNNVRFMADAVIRQRSYYPLCPAPMEAAVELSQDKCVKMPVTPHVLLLPSDLFPCFVMADKDAPASPDMPSLHGTVLVNPGRVVARQAAQGMYARIVVQPSSTPTASIVPSTHVQIYRLNRRVL